MAPPNLPLPQAGAAEVIADVQKRPSPRTIDIDKVGVKNISYPIVVLDKFNGTQHTVAKINMYVNLPHRHKGTHMSRFIEILSECRRDISIRNIEAILEETRKRLHAQSAHIEMTFPYFIDKPAPVSRRPGPHGVHLHLQGFPGMETARSTWWWGSPCPSPRCAPAEGDQPGGAHNQRGEVRVQVRFKRFFWIEDLIRQVEESASCEVYALLKRQDEKYVTERAYKNPMFVEDVVREIAHKLRNDQNSALVAVESENSSPSTTTPPTPTSSPNKIPGPGA